MREVVHNKKKYSQYFFVIILLFFISLLSFNLVRTYTDYLSVKGKVNNIISLVNKQKQNNYNLKKQYKYYTTDYKQSRSSNSSNSSGIILPKSSISTYVNISNKKKTSSDYSKPSLINWIKTLF